MSDEAAPELTESNPWAISIRLKHYNTSKTRFQIKHDFRDGPQPDYVDGDRSHLNSGKQGMTAVEYRTLMLERRKMTAPKRAPMLERVAVMTGGIITFGHLAQVEILKLTDESQDAMYLEIARAFADRLNNEVTAWASHRDETAPHFHFQMPSRRSSDGKLMSEVLKPSITSEFQDIAAEIAQKYAPRIERGAKKENTKARNKSVRELHRTKTIDFANSQLKLKQVNADILTAKTRLATNEARAEKARLRAKENDKAAEKALRNAARYEQRAADAKDELSKLEEELDRLTALRSEISDAEERLKPLKAAMAALDAHEANMAAQVEAAFQSEIEAEAANLMFEQNIDHAAIAILASGDTIDWGPGYGRMMGDWKFKGSFEDAGLAVPATGMTDFRGVMSALSNADAFEISEQMEVFKADPTGEREFDDVRRGLYAIHNAFQSTKVWSRDLLRKARAVAGEMIVKSYDRLVAALKQDRVNEINKLPPPKEAAPFTELPEDTQTTIRSAISAKGPEPS